MKPEMRHNGSLVKHSSQGGVQTFNTWDTHGGNQVLGSCVSMPDRVPPEGNWVGKWFTYGDGFCHPDLTSLKLKEPG